VPARLKIGLQALSVAVVAGLLGLLVWKVVHQDKGAASELAKGKHPAAPHFDLGRLDRQGRLSLASLRGKVVVVNFWASWCVPCKSEAPRLEAAWQRWRGRGVVVVGVDAQDFSGDARRFIRRYELTYPNVHDGPGKVLPAYGVTGFPETYFIDRRGRLVGERIQGEISTEKLASGIRSALES
jgi:cytochrome c biogenesis protein CcmG, thiol:disulfide interchange protein DsbE